MAKSSQKQKRDIVNGVLLLDKPDGISSNDALTRARRLLNARKGGHTGTLDPFATGLLPLCFGEATKFSHDLLNSDKVYETTVHLGVTTSTGDTEGDVTGTDVVDVDANQIEAALAAFRGDIEQVPPMHSALKFEGKPLYEYARAGVTLERKARKVTIHSLELLDYTPPYLRLHVHCSKGTYIRVLGEDIGEYLGCGAHLKALRRVQVGHLTLEGAHKLAELENVLAEEREALLQPVDSLLSTLPVIELDPDLTRRYLHGQRLPLAEDGTDILELQGRVRVYRASDYALLGTGVISPYGVLAPERLIATQE